MADVKDMKRYYTIDMQVMLKFGLTISKWMLLELVHFRQAVADNGYCDDTRKELAEAINLKASTVKNLVSQLVTDGYLKRNSKNHIKTTPKWHKLQSLNGKNLDEEEGSFQNDGSNKRGHSKMTEGSFQNDGNGHSKMTTISIYRENKEREERSDALDVANYLLKKILTVKPNFKTPNIDNWVKDIDKAIRLDKRTKRELINAIDFIYSPKGTFWQANILSGAKLREKFDTLEMQAIRAGGNSLLEKNKQAVDKAISEYKEEEFIWG